MSSADGEGGRLEFESRARKRRPVGDTNRYKRSIRRDKKQEKAGKVQSVDTEEKVLECTERMTCIGGPPIQGQGVFKSDKTFRAISLHA